MLVLVRFCCQRVMKKFSFLGDLWVLELWIRHCGLISNMQPEISQQRSKYLKINMSKLNPLYFIPKIPSSPKFYILFTGHIAKAKTLSSGIRCVDFTCQSSQLNFQTMYGPPSPVRPWFIPLILVPWGSTLKHASQCLPLPLTCRLLQKSTDLCKIQRHGRETQRCFNLRALRKLIC